MEILKLKAIKHHIQVVCKHKWEVFKCMSQCGHPIRGFMHDWSKFSPTEFKESIKFFQNGKRSPLDAAREIQGYSLAWFHHRGRNKHHSQYWVDASFGEIKPCKMPWIYLIELICDGVAAGRTYLGDKWTCHSPLQYYNQKEYKSFFHPETRKMLCLCYEYIDKNGWDKFAKMIKEIKTNKENDLNY